MWSHSTSNTCVAVTSLENTVIASTSVVWSLVVAELRSIGGPVLMHVVSGSVWLYATTTKWLRILDMAWMDFSLKYLYIRPLEARLSDPCWRTKFPQMSGYICQLHAHSTTVFFVWHKCLWNFHCHPSVLYRGICDAWVCPQRDEPSIAMFAVLMTAIIVTSFCTRTGFVLHCCR